MTSKSRQELNFTALQSALLEPAYALYSATNDMKASRSRARCFAKAEAIEGLCWLALGTSLNYFPPDFVSASRWLAAKRIGGLPGLQEFVSDWKYLFDPAWLDYATTAFERLKVANDLESPLSMDLSVEPAEQAFESCFLRAICLSRTAPAKGAVAILNFDRSDDIAEFLKLTTTSDDISDALAMEMGIDLESGDVLMGALYGGFGELVNFLEAFRELHEHFSEDETANAVFRKVAQLLRWRFYFIETKADPYQDFINRYMDVLGVTEHELRQLFQAHIEDLADHWRGMQGPALAYAYA